MVDYLLQDNVVETLVGFITQNGTGRQRPSPNDQLGEEMKLAYKYVDVLCRFAPGGVWLMCCCLRCL